MKEYMKSIRKISCISPLFMFAGLLVSAAVGQSQTTWTGTHIFNDLRVGTTGNPGSTIITGQTGGGAAPGLEVTGDGGVVFTGSFGSGVIPTETLGTRMMWYPGKSSLLVGTDDWSDDYTGSYSFAFGDNSTILGSHAMAFGSDVYEYGNYSMIFGSGVLSSGNYSLYFGNDSANGLGDYSFGFGTMIEASSRHMAFGNYIFSTGAYSMSFGHDIYVDGNSAIGFGAYNYTGGNHAIAIGSNNNALSHYGVAIGDAVTSMGTHAIAVGTHLNAVAYGSLVIGKFNVGSYDSVNGGDANWVATDPIFEIGNGTGDEYDAPEIMNRNAFTIYKNGNVDMTGKIRMPRQGDILMGEFGEEE